MKVQQPQLFNLKYRPDIDGLRAVAVLVVVAFHAFPTWIRGGFIGVDVFFVISGYLISTNIFETLDIGAFSFSDFYSRRIKRIFPALILVLIACFLLGWVALLADEYKQLGKHMAAGAGFISNFVLLNEAGYFDNSAETKPLLHLWSLGVEEQFYIVWPLFVWATWRCKFNIGAIMIALTSATFFLNVRGVQQDVISAFYSPWTRFWELLSGSILAWIELYKNESPLILNKFKFLLNGIVNSEGKEVGGEMLASTLSFVGLLLLMYGFLEINKELSFPGVWSLVPVLGAVLIIQAGPRAWVNRRILSNNIIVGLGLISYPLYLWHWPILSFARIIESEVLSLNMRIGAVAISICLAWLTYRLIERPLRYGKQINVKVTVLAVCMAIVGYAGYSVYERDGLKFRMEEREQFVNSFENNFPSWTYFKQINLYKEWRLECGFFNVNDYLAKGRLDGGGADSKPIDELASSCYKRNPRFDKSVLIWGDSHAQSLSPGLTNFMPNNWQILQVASSGCSPNPSFDLPSVESQCKQSNYFAMKTIKDVIPDVVVIAQANGHSPSVMVDIAAKLTSLGIKKVVFLGPTPQWNGDLPKIIARQLWVTKPMRTYIGINRNILVLNDVLLREFTPVGNSEFVNLIGVFCDSKGCLTHTDGDFKASITTWDYGHLTPSASKYLAKNFLVKRIVGE